MLYTELASESEKIQIKAEIIPNEPEQVMLLREKMTKNLWCARYKIVIGNKHLFLIKE